MKQIWSFVGRHRTYTVLGIGLVVVLFLLLFQSLYNLTGGQYAKTELLTQGQSSSLRTILDEPAGAPHKLLVWLGLKLGHHSILVTRLASALIAIPLVGLFYLVVRHWFAPRVALIGTCMFATSGGFLHFARYGTPMILQMAPLVLLAALFLYRKIPPKYRVLAAYAIALIGCAIMYIPGMVWFALVGVALLWRRFHAAFRVLGPIHTTIVTCVIALLLTPLAYAIFKDPSVLRNIAGLPETIPTVSHVAGEAKHLISSMVYRGYWPAEYWLIGAPLLNIAEVVLFIAGIWLLLRRRMIRGNYYLLAALAIGSVFVILQGSVSIALLVPLVYFVITGGLHLLLDEWIKVFPRNLFATILAVTLISLLAAFSALYQTRGYFQAWPRAPETKTVYATKQPS